MTVWHEGAWRRSDEDQTVRIKDKWARVMGSWSTNRARRGCIMFIQALFSEMDSLDISRWILL